MIDDNFNPENERPKVAVVMWEISFYYDMKPLIVLRPCANGRRAESLGFPPFTSKKYRFPWSELVQVCQALTPFLI